MKKVIFSAIVMVAFVGSSMANTIMPLESKVSAFIQEPNWLCVSVGFASSDAVIANGGTPAQATAAAEAAYNRCVSVINTAIVIDRVISQ